MKKVRVCLNCNKEEFYDHISNLVPSGCGENYEYEHSWSHFFLFEDGEPCKHPFCERHIKSFCEGCGRVGAKGSIYIYQHSMENFIWTNQEY